MKAPLKSKKKKAWSPCYVVSAVLVVLAALGVGLFMKWELLDFILAYATAPLGLAAANVLKGREARGGG